MVQSLVFDLRWDMEDLWFCLETLNDKAPQLLQFLSTLHDAHHLPAEAAQVATTQLATTSTLVLALENLVHAKVDRQE
jgi:hypothetical protein